MRKLNYPIYKIILYVILLFSLLVNINAKESEYFLEEHKFISYGKLPTWKGVCTDWNTSPKSFIYDRRVFKGHSDFISKGLGKKINFEEFRKKAKISESREYLPFYIYDLTDSNVEINNKKYKYALRLQDYNYNDPPLKMVKEILKLTELINKDSNGEFEDPLIVLNKKKVNVLSINTIGDILIQAEYSPISLDRLLKLVGGNQLEVLNSGIAVGRLRKVRTQKEADKLTRDDIALLTFLPDRLPPVAGIITLKPQTPLSHVNLLAKNRGTFNMYITNYKALPNLKKYIGKYVYIDDKQNEVSIHKVTKKFVASFRLKNPPTKIIIPSTEKNFWKVLPLRKKNEEYITTSQIGAKAYNYYRIRQIIPDHVRPAYAIGFQPYYEVLKQGARAKIGELLENKSNWNLAKRREKLKEIRDFIKIANYPENTLMSLRKIIDKHYKGKRIRLRSSTNCEDLKEFNGAGLYNSKGFKVENSNEELGDKLLEVYASFWNDYAFEEREYYGLSHLNTGMAVLIHESFPKEKANGVALTIPNKNKIPGILVNVQVGNISVANPIAGYIAESFYIKHKSDLIGKINTRSNVKNIFIENPNFENVLEDLRRSIIKIHNNFILDLTKEETKFGIDIEFKIMEENGSPKLYIKQARLLKY